jgi:dihydrofolate synthase/folylpolyglutamate synthase
MIRAVADVVDDFVVTTAPSARTTDPDELAAVVVAAVGADRVTVEPDLERALDTARELALEVPETAEGEPGEGAVLAFGSITLIGAVLQLARSGAWSR